MSYLPTQIKSYFKKTDNNSEISEHDSLSIDEKKSKINFNPYPYLKTIPSKLNFGEKKHNILQLTCSTAITSGQPITWYTSLSNSSIKIKDDYILEITESGFYHILGQFCATPFYIKENSDSFALALQVNYKAVSLIYCQISKEQMHTIFINEIIYLEKDDILTVSMGNTTIVHTDNNELMNKLTVLKL